MAKRFTDTEKYKKPFIRGLQGAYKLLWDYLYHDCNHAGVWHKDFEIAQIYLGQDMPVNENDALKYFNDGEERIVTLNGGSKWFIRPFVEFQYGCLEEGNRVHRSVITELLRSGVNKGLIRSLQGRKDKDKDKDRKESVREKQDLITSIKKNPVFEGIDIDREFLKMDEWLKRHPDRKKTERFIINWLNKIEKVVVTPKKEKKPKEDCETCQGSGKLPDGKKCWCW